MVWPPVAAVFAAGDAALPDVLDDGAVVAAPEAPLVVVAAPVAEVLPDDDDVGWLEPPHAARSAAAATLAPVPAMRRRTWRRLNDRPG
jgi:hypothetical protein